MFKSYKYRLYPKPHQAELIDKTISTCRLVFNLGLEVKIRAYKEHGVSLSSFKIGNQLPELKNAYPWMKEVASGALCSSVNKIDLAFKGFFNGNGYPNFKKKRVGGSFECHKDVRRINWENNTLSISKIPKIPIKLSRRFEGEMRKITISKTSTGKYFASILVKSENEITENKLTGKGLGIDLGLSHFAVLSDGVKIENPKHYRSNMKRLAVLQRRASRKKKGSKNRKKQLLKVAILNERIKNRRNDFLHKISRKIACDSQVGIICVEDLGVANMVKNRNLSTSISDAGWYEFVRQLEYKTKWGGKSLIKINRYFPSSKTCSCCGYIKEDMPLVLREWQCEKCLTQHDRDINAAINIKNIGMSGRETPVEPVELPALAGVKKQEESTDSFRISSTTVTPFPH